MKFINLFTKKIPLYVSLILMAVSGLSVYYYVYKKYNSTEYTASNSLAAFSGASQYCLNRPVRLSGYSYIGPLLFVDQLCESDTYTPLKEDVASKIAGFQQSGIITTASVYFRSLETSEWIVVNDNELYQPGSLLKVPELITFLKMEELYPGTLNKQYSLDKLIDNSIDKHPLFVSKSIEAGKSYTVKELLHYMITYSDNNATIILNKYMDVNVFNKLFKDVGLPNLDVHASTYPISAQAYSRFFRLIFNASYLTKEHSEYAAELLSTSDFKDGFVKGLPPNTKIIHKFGEGGDNDLKQLSESGIVYVNNAPYLLTVMTKGHDMQKLPQVLSNIANTVYNRVVQVQQQGIK